MTSLILKLENNNNGLNDNCYLSTYVSASLHEPSVSIKPDGYYVLSESLLTELRSQEVKWVKNSILVSDCQSKGNSLSLILLLFVGDLNFEFMLSLFYS